jgi:hypothetical protein
VAGSAVTPADDNGSGQRMQKLGTEPGTKNNEPGTTNLETTNLEERTWNFEPGTTNLELRTKN